MTGRSRDSRRWPSTATSRVYTHAARQRPGGKWTSKLGKAEDIEHDTPDVVAGGLYGEVVLIMRRHESPGATSVAAV